MTSQISAAWHLRALASLVDIGVLSLLFLPFALIGIAIMLIAGMTAEGLKSLLSIISFIYLLVSICYFPYLMSRFGERNGQTLGKQVMGIKVVKTSGEPIGIGYAFVREALIKPGILLLSARLFLIPLLVDVLWPLIDKDKRALHDIPMNSLVIKVEEPYFRKVTGSES